MILIDGTILNILTETKSNQACPICGAAPQKFANTTDFKCNEFTLKPNSLQYGISPLHSWIRFFKCILHISYRIGLKKWQVRGEENRKLLHERKQEVQQRFWENMSLHVDKPKANGSGNTNDGNTARRAFGHPELFAKITNVEQSLINNFRIILISLSCEQMLDLEKFEKFCVHTADLYMEKYPWFPMPATFHKVLIHAKEILQNTILPAGYFAEEASEARNKLYKRDREFHARKNSRIHNLEDIFNRAMDTSNPVVSSTSLQRRLKIRHKLCLPSEVIAMLSPP